MTPYTVVENRQGVVFQLGVLVRQPTTRPNSMVLDLIIVIKPSPCVFSLTVFENKEMRRYDPEDGKATAYSETS
jgi:hypothetical protein